MKINKITYVCELAEKIPDFCNNIRKIEISLNAEEDRIGIFIDAGSVKIEDKSNHIDARSILAKISDINFDEIDNFRTDTEFNSNKWKLIVNDKSYEGVISEPYPVVQFKKIIRYSTLELYIRKKIGQYLR